MTQPGTQAGTQAASQPRTRAARRRAYADANGFAAARIEPLAQDASFRSYWRLRGGPAPAVLMDAPPAHEDIRPYLAVGARLRQAGLSVPAVIAADADAGLMLLEDFGDRLFAGWTGADAPLRYDTATDALAVLARAAAPADPLPHWGPAEMTQAACLTFLDWWWPASFGHPAPPETRAAFQAALGAMLAVLATLPPGLVHRDYFAGNLFWLPGRPGRQRVGIIDFQDAALGPPAYDLVSLVEDARRDLPPSLIAHAQARYLALRPELDPADFAAAYAVCAAQRHLRVAALWVRLDRRDGKPAYLEHGPRCWAMLDRALAHPATAPLAAFLDAHVPRARRCNPEQASA